MPNKKEIIGLLENIADLLEYNNENPFKINAFRSGANSIKRYESELDEIIKSKSLDKIKGIGKGLQAVIYEFYNTGTSKVYEELLKGAPSGINELLKIRGLGPKKIKILYTELGISNIGELEYACKENRLALLKGFGEATQNKITGELQKLKAYSKFILLNKAEEISDEILGRISRFKTVLKIAVSGEMRRGMEIVSEIRFVVLISAKKAFKKELGEIFSFSEEEDKFIINDDYPVPIVFYTLEKENEFAGILLLTTGSDDFISMLKLRGRKLIGIDEHEIFGSMKLPFVIPEMREKEYFEQKKTSLKKNSDLSFDHFKGLLHFHTTYSDARNSLADMIMEAKRTGFEYAAVCDHSKSAVYANGLSEERILQQKQAIIEVSINLKLPVLQGIESDILQNGDLDYSNDFLKTFDFVVASIHSRFNMEKDEMTNRIIKAIENPYTDLLGHPSGRLLLSRDPYKLDTKKVIDACSANNVAIEINASPHRLDLDWRWIYYAREKECLFSINPDAHSIEEIGYIKYGIMSARKGGLMYEEVINCFSYKDFKTFLNRKVKRIIG